VKTAIDARLAELGFTEGLKQVETFITDLKRVTGSTGAQGWQKLGERIRSGEVVLGVPENIPPGTIRTFIGPNGKPFITQKGVVRNGEKVLKWLRSPPKNNTSNILNSAMRLWKNWATGTI